MHVVKLKNRLNYGSGSNILICNPIRPDPTKTVDPIHEPARVTRDSLPTT